MGREVDAADPGTYFLATVDDEPLVIVRGRDEVSARACWLMRPEEALSMLAFVTGSRSSLTSSWLTGTLDGLLLGDDVLSQPGTTGFALLGADVEPLLGTGHRIVGRLTGGVAANGSGLDVVVHAVTVTVGALLCRVVPAPPIAEAVVAVELGLVLG